MDTLICILLYLGAICSPCEYYQDEIEQIETQYQDSIDPVLDDPAYLEQVVHEFSGPASLVEVNYREEGEE